MGFLVSPGVDINEVDLTNIIPAVSTSIGGFVGKFRWGPSEEHVTVGSENELAATFGKPNTANLAEDYFNAAGFLQYANNLKIYRDASTSKNASSNSTGLLSSVTITNKGDGYVEVPEITPNITGASLEAQMEIEDFDFDTSAVSASYAVGDVVTVNFAAGDSSPNAREATFRIDAVDSSAIKKPTAVSIINKGTYGGTAQARAAFNQGIVAEVGGTRLADETVTAVSSSGAGLKITDATLQLKNVVVVTAGSGKTGTPTVDAPDGTSDSPAAAQTTAVLESVFAGNVEIKNEDDYERQNLAEDLGNFIARYQGALGNSLQVAVVTNASFAAGAGNYGSTSINAKELFDGAPLTDNGGIDQIHIAVIDEDGDITGVANTVLETFQFLSVVSTEKKDDGTSNYYIDVLQNKSNWIYGNPNSIVSSGATDHTIQSLSGGVDTEPSKENLAASYEAAFKDNKDTVDVNLLIGGSYPAASAKTIADIAVNRKDCVAFISPEIADTANITNSATQLSNVEGFVTDSAIDSNYAVIDSTSLYVYDKYNDTYRYIPAAGHVAGLCANTDNVADAWFSPAGYNRGGLRGVTKLAFNPTTVERDSLYQNNINPIVSFPGQGILLFGDKTAQKKPSAFDRINVRRLFIVLEKAIATASKFQLFEFNDEFTRAQFRNLVEPFLRDVKGRRGITDFLVVCDETNNTGDVIENNRFVADIYIKPARSINFITLNFIATRAGVEFSEITGSN